MMKYIKGFLSLGLIPLGALLGSYISIGGGSGAILGGILGGILCCFINWSPSRGKSGFWPGSINPNEKYEVNNNVDGIAIDNTIKKVREVIIEEQLRHPHERFYS